MSYHPGCDKPKCPRRATAFVGIRVGEHISRGYFMCDEDQAEGFWLVTKMGLRQHEAFDIVLLDVAQVEDLKISRA